MKRLLIAVLVLSFTIIFSLGSYFLICRRVDNVIYLMENDRNITVSSGETDKERTKKILDEWLKHENLLVSLLTHHELEDIEIGVRCLEDYMQQGLTEEYIKTLNECINKLKHVKETELPDIKNIF